jgi:hypothetical protein
MGGFRHFRNSCLFPGKVFLNSVSKNYYWQNVFGRASCLTAGIHFLGHKGPQRMSEGHREKPELIFEVLYYGPWPYTFFVKRYPRFHALVFMMSI